jgi:hypothetical protein
MQLQFVSFDSPLMLRRTGTARDERDQGGEIQQDGRQGSAERLVTIATQTLRTDAMDRPVPRRRAINRRASSKGTSPASPKSFDPMRAGYL